MTVFGGMIAVSFIGSIMVPAFFVAVNTMKEWTANNGKTVVKNLFSKGWSKTKTFSAKAGKSIVDKINKNKDGGDK